MSGGVWVASYVALWVAVLALGGVVLLLLRQIGVLHARLAPLGAHFAGEGPVLDDPAPPIDGTDYRTAAFTLVAFASPTCEVCATLRPGFAAVARQYGDVTLRLVDLDDHTRGTFEAFNVRSTPYLVAVDRAGLVRGRGVVNSLEQIEELLGEAADRADGTPGPPAPWA